MHQKHYICLVLSILCSIPFSRLGSTPFPPASGVNSQPGLQQFAGLLDKSGLQWAPYLEWSLQNPTFSGNPFDVIATATFVHQATGTSIQTGMFYDGASTWKFRFTGTKTGVWTFTTHSVDADLDGHSGTVTIAPNPNPDVAGFVTSFGNKWGRQGLDEAFVPQYVMYVSPHGYYNNPAQIDADIQTFMVEHGFTGFHTMVSCRWFDLNEPSYTNIAVPNPDFKTFEALELLITKVHAAGGVIHIWAWGDEQGRQTPIKWGKNGPEDRRLQRYIAARLGPLPGWTMGYGFDLDEWVVEQDLQLWHDYMQQQLGWPHFLGGRDPGPNFAGEPYNQIYEGLDYSGYEQHKPDYQRYVNTIEARFWKPSFSEDRFRIRGVAVKDYTMVEVRRGLWHSTMAGGVANIWGNLTNGAISANTGLRSSAPFPHPEWIKTNAQFFARRFLRDMVRDNTITDGVCLKLPLNTHYIFYKEDTKLLQMDLSAMAGSQPAVAVDTRLPYQEFDLGQLINESQTWTAPYTSDWAVAVGPFAHTAPNPPSQVPQVTSFFPTSGPVGSSVTISGSNFIGVTQVSFNGTMASRVTVDSASEIQVSVPPGATDGPIGIVNLAGSATSVDGFTVTQIQQNIVLNPVEDSFVRSNRATNNYGNSVALRVRHTSSSEHNTYLKFNVSGLIAAPQSVTLRLFVTDDGDDGGSVYSVSNSFQSSTSPWTEDGLIWNNASNITGAPLASIGPVSLNQTVEIDLTAVVIGNGVYSFALKNNSSNVITYSSKEGTSPPELVIVNAIPPAPIPSIHSFNPTSGAIATQVTIVGSDFGSATEVSFGGVPASAFSIESDSKILATVPVGASSGKVAITNANGTGVSATDFTVISPPQIASFSPTSGPFGREVTVLGSRFVAVTGVTFGIAPASSFTAISERELRAIVPPGASSGKISVTNSAGTGVSAGDFAVSFAPVISSFSPSSGPAGNEVTILGTNFTGTTDVSFNGTSGLFSFDSDTQLRALVPVAATTGPIGVTNVHGTDVSADDFTVISAPTITTFSPLSSPPLTEVTITGTSFNTVTQVDFGGTVAASFNIDSDTQIRAEVPVGAPSGPIRVTNPAGMASSGSDLTVTSAPSTIVLNPTDDSFARSSRPTTNYGTNQEMIVRGTASATYHTYLKFKVAGIAGPVQSAKIRLQVTSSSDDGGAIYAVSNNYQDNSGPWTEDGLIWHNAPPLSGTQLSALGQVSLGEVVEFDVTAAITGNNTYSFAIKSNSVDAVRYMTKEWTTPPQLVIDVLTTSAPIISNFSPTSGIPGTQVTIFGKNFLTATSVQFNGTATTFNIVSDSEIQTQVPAAATTGKINISNVDGAVGSTIDFTVIGPPMVSSFAPTGGPVGTEVTVSGTGLSTTVAVGFNGAVGSFSVDSDSQLRAIVPAGATSGPISVTNAAGTAASQSAFNIILIPVITSFTPTSGVAGDEVTIAGENFTGTTAVLFNNVPASGFVVASDTEIRAVIPVGATTGKVSVTNGNGTTASVSDFTVVVVPAIVSFSPASGPISSEVTILGSGFIEVTQISFSGTAASQFTVDSDSQIRATIPSNATTGKITVLNGAGTATSVDDFMVTAASPVQSFIPSDDAYVHSNRPSLNRGSPPDLRVRKSSSARYDSYLKFQVTGVVGMVSSARLRLFVEDGSNDSGIYSVSNLYQDGSGPWNESGITWENAPEIVGTPLSSQVAVAGTVVEYDVTSAISGNGTYSLAIRNNSKDVLTLTSKEGSLPPELVVSTSPSNGPSAPVISSFSPTSGPAATEVTITGSHFTGATQVRFNGVASSAFSEQSGGQIFATVPAGATTGKISVITPGGTAVTVNDFTVENPPSTAPTISGFTPTSGAVGTVVTIQGANFTGVTEVAFNGVTAASLVGISDAEILVTVPASATSGKIRVTTQQGTAFSNGDFIVSAVGGTILSFIPSDDSFVRSSRPSKNYGAAVDLRLRKSSSAQQVTYFKFNITGLTGTILTAKLKLVVLDSGDDGGAIYSVSNSYEGATEAWVEDNLIWGNAPKISGTALSSVGPVGIGTTVEFDVTLAISTDGIYSFAIRNGSSDVVMYNSKESAFPPELVIETGVPSALTLKSAEIDTNLQLSDSQNAPDAESAGLPTEFTLDQNYPNPFNPATTISYAVPKAGELTLAIYNVRGQLVKTLVSRAVASGRFKVVWDGKDANGFKVASGVYIYRLEAEDFVASRRLVLTK